MTKHYRLMLKVISIAPNGGGKLEIEHGLYNYCNKMVIGSYNKTKAQLLRLSGNKVQIWKDINGDIFVA